MSILKELESRRETIKKELSVLSRLLVHRAKLQHELEAVDLLIERTKEREKSGERINVPEKFKSNKIELSGLAPAPAEIPRELSKGVAQDVFRAMEKIQRPMRAAEIKRVLEAEGESPTGAAIRQALYRNSGHFVELQPRIWGLREWIIEETEC